MPSFFLHADKNLHHTSKHITTKIGRTEKHDNFEGKQIVNKKNKTARTAKFMHFHTFCYKQALF